MRLEIELNATALPLTENKATEQSGAASSPVFALLLKHGIAAAQEGDRDRAREFLTQAAEVNPQSEDAWMWLASISDYPEELLAFLDRVLTINPDNEKATVWRLATRSLLAKTLAQRGVLAQKENDVELAGQCSEQALDLDEKCESAWMLKATLAENEDQKLEFLEKVLEINTENVEARSAIETVKNTSSLATFAKAKAAAAAGDHTKALEILEEFLKSSPQSVEGWTLKSHLYVSLAEKVEALENALEIDPDNAAARSGLAFLVLTFGSSQETLSSEKPDQADFTETNKLNEPAQDDVYSIEVSDDAPSAESYEFQEAEAASADEPDLSEFDETVKPANEFEDTATKSAKFQELDDETTNAFDDTVSPGFQEPTAYTAVEATEPDADPEALAFSSQPTDETILIDLPSVEDAFEPSIESQFFGDQNEADGHENGSWKSRVGMIDPWLSPAQPLENATSETETETDPSRTLEELFGQLPETVDTDRKTVETLYPLVSEPETQTEVFTTVDQTNPLHCSFCTAPNTVDAAECFACHAPFAKLENNFNADAKNVETVDENLVGAVVAEIHYTGTACPFCSSFNDTQAFACSNCNATLTLSDIGSLLSNPRANHDLIQQSVTQMEAEWNLREFDEQELAALAIGHFNLGNSASGFSYLQEAVRLDANNVILAGQLNAIAIRLDEMRRHHEAYETIPKGRTIMVVDDSPTVRKLISGKLEKSGHNVVCAVDGVDALARLEEALPDLILLDIAMPRLDGYEVCKQIRSNPVAKDLPIVMISGKDGFFDKVRGRMAGCTGYVTKPFGPETLMKALETYLLPVEHLVEVEAN